jgi:DNA-binding GntR family transcriptional regulator
MPVFDGLMGNTSNLRVISFLLPFTHAKFTEKDLIEEVGVSKPTMIKAMTKLVEYELITKVEQKGNSIYYRVNTASPFIKAFEDLDNLIIHHKYSETLLRQEEPNTVPEPKTEAEGIEYPQRDLEPLIRR